MADLEAKTPISTQNAFYVGSIAKQFTAMSILLLAEQGKLSLTDDIHKYLPELPDYGTPITIQNLIHHTSGIKEYYDLWDQKAINEWDGNLVEHAAEINAANSLTLIATQKTLNFSPGDKYVYTNTNYFLLGEIVERVSGKSLRQFADESVFRPLGMTHTQYRDDAKITIPNLAVGYVLNPDGSLDPQHLRYQLYTLVGEGGLYTTLDDLLKWDQNFYHNQLGKKDPHLIDQILATQALNNGEPNNYAFGLVVMEYRGINRYGSWDRSRGGYLAGRTALSTQVCPFVAFTAIGKMQTPLWLPSAAVRISSRLPCSSQKVDAGLGTLAGVAGGVSVGGKAGASTVETVGMTGSAGGVEQDADANKSSATAQSHFILTYLICDLSVDPKQRDRYRMGDANP